MWAARVPVAALPMRLRRPLSNPRYNASLYAGIINSEGRLWKSQRRFLHEKLREFGMTYMGNGKKVMEGRIKVCTNITTKKKQSKTIFFTIFLMLY